VVVGTAAGTVLWTASAVGGGTAVVVRVVVVVVGGTVVGGTAAAAATGRAALVWEASFHGGPYECVVDEARRPEAAPPR